jgi:hypothetical protein
MSANMKMMADPEFSHRLDQFQRGALFVGCTGLVLSLAAWALWPAHFFAAYLLGYLYWIGLALGCIGLTMLHHLTGGAWGLPIRRPLEAGAATVIPLALLFLPIAFGMRSLYPWARPGAPGYEPALATGEYLSGAFFLARAACYFAVWIAMALVLSESSLRQDSTTEPAPSRRLQRLSGPGTVILFLTGTFSAIDWAMSLEPRWTSTVYGPMLITGDAMATLALMIVVSSRLASGRPMSEIATPERLHDLGNLLLAFVMLWAYMYFCQYLIVWSGNLTEEIPWYLRRTRGGWEWFGLALIICQFFLPFFVLLFRESKRNVRYLLAVAVWVLAIRWIDLTWVVIPAFSDPSSPRIPWGELALSAATTAGVGGIVAAFFIGRLKRGPLVPLGDPNLIEALEHSGA